MIHFRQSTVKMDGEVYSLTPKKINSFDSFYVDFQQNKDGVGEVEMQLFLHPKEQRLLQSLTLEFDIPSAGFQAWLSNAFHSSGDNRIFHLNQKYPDATPLYPGDKSLQLVPSGKGIFSSWSYAELQGTDQKLILQSLNEQTGFTVFTYDATTGILKISRDFGVSGLLLRHSFPALHFRIASLVPNAAVLPSKTLLWHSSPGRDTEQFKTEIAAIANWDIPVTHIGIWPGWAAKTGDWMSDFMIAPGTAADTIRQQKMNPVLCLSPFAADPQSKLLQQNPSWALRDEKGNMVKTHDGLVALQANHSGLRDYLSGVFYLITSKWEIRQLCLSHLYIAALLPPAEKTSGQMMQESMEFLMRSTPGCELTLYDQPIGLLPTGNTVLGCMPISNIPQSLWNTLSAVQYQRTKGIPVLAGDFELQAVKPQKEANRQFTLLMLQALLSDRLSFSGDYASLPPEIAAELAEALLFREAQVHEIQEIAENIVRIQCILGGDTRTVLVNLSDKKRTVMGNYGLAPFETLVF